jgi:hypothetical protein
VKTLRALLLGLALVAGTAACGGDDDSADDTTTSEETTTTLSEEEEKEAAGAAVVEYFKVLGEGNVDAAVPLLEDGEEWRDEMVACSTITTGVTARLKTVELTDATNATAAIDILGPGGNVLQAAESGVVKTEDGWVVASSTFQSLYDLAKDACTGGSTTTTAAG